MDLTKIDKNFASPVFGDRNDIVFKSVRERPFRVYGLYDYKNQKEFIRLPEEVSKEVSPNVHALSFHTAGGRARFKTSSSFIAIKAEMKHVSHMVNMCLIGSSCFDIYINRNGLSTYYRSLKPSTTEITNGFEAIVGFEDLEYKPEVMDITIVFPLYNELTELYIGLEKGAILDFSDEYSYRKPVVYYGSSITQGGCASRPGNSYEEMLSRRFNIDYINLGFSGNAKGEQAMADYIAGLDMLMFVMDYDHNAPDCEHLYRTHYNFYKTIREKNPDLPVILLSRPNFDTNIEAHIPRRTVVYNTYQMARNDGDRNIYFIDGESLFGGFGRDSCTCDGCHPNDLGFYRMAEKIGSVMERILIYRTERTNF